MAMTTSAGNTILRAERADHAPGSEQVVCQAGPYAPKAACMEFLLPEGWTPERVDELIQTRATERADQERQAQRQSKCADLRAQFESELQQALDDLGGTVDAMTPVELSAAILGPRTKVLGDSAARQQARSV